MPTPEELLVRQRFSEAHARRIDTEVGQIDPNDLWTSVRSKIRDIFWRFNDQPLEETESDLHVLWDTIIQAAIIADKPAQDRLVAEVGFARELGSLSPYDMTTDGVLWSWLPFLVEDVSLAWLENLMRLKTEERLNLTKFTARLVEAGVCAPELGFCAVFVLRETLETPRALKVTEYGESGTSVPTYSRLRWRGSSLRDTGSPSTPGKTFTILSREIMAGSPVWENWLEKWVF